MPVWCLPFRHYCMFGVVGPIGDAGSHFQKTCALISVCISKDVCLYHDVFVGPVTVLWFSCNCGKAWNPLSSAEQASIFFFFFCFRASNGIKYAVELGMLENVPQPFYEMPWLDITKCFVLTVTRPNVWNFWFKFRIITVWLYLFLKSKFLVYLTWGFFLFGKIFYQLGEFVSASLGCAYQHITLLYLYCFVIVNVVIDLFMMLCRPSVRLTWCFKS